MAEIIRNVRPIEIQVSKICTAKSASAAVASSLHDITLKVTVKVKVMFLCLTKYHIMKMYGGAF
jgi:hypothetical protein